MVNTWEWLKNRKTFKKSGEWEDHQHQDRVAKPEVKKSTFIRVPSGSDAKREPVPLWA